MGWRCRRQHEGQHHQAKPLHTGPADGAASPGDARGGSWGGRVPRASSGGLPAGTPSGAVPWRRHASSAQRTEGNAMRSQNLIPREQSDLQALDASREPRRRRSKPGAEHDVDLADPTDREDAENPIDLNARLAFPRFRARPPPGASHRVRETLPAGSKALAWLDRPAAQQHGGAGNNHRADHDLRVLVGNVSTVRADHALAGVAFRTRVQIRT